MGHSGLPVSSLRCIAALGNSQAPPGGTGRTVSANLALTSQGPCLRDPAPIQVLGSGSESQLGPWTQVKMLLPQQLVPFRLTCPHTTGQSPGQLPPHVPIGLAPRPTETSAPCHRCRGSLGAGHAGCCPGLAALGRLCTPGLCPLTLPITEALGAGRRFLEAPSLVQPASTARPPQSLHCPVLPAA